VAYEEKAPQSRSTASKCGTPPRDENLTNLLEQARSLSWRNFGKKITFYLPGMIKYGGERGLYPAISITGAECSLGCDHCKGKILAPMIHAATPATLIKKCQSLAENGAIGFLITGGSDTRGVMPWDEFADAIAEIKESTGLHLSIHTGIISSATAHRLRAAGVNQALVDLIGDDATVAEIFHLNGGVQLIRDSVTALIDAGIEVIPHIVIGLHRGAIRGEYKAIELAREINISTLVFVVLTPFKNGPMEGVIPPSAEDVAEIVASARLRLPHTTLSLGCERSRGKEGLRTELYAVEAGMNRIAIQSDAAVALAQSYGLEIRYQKTCCSVGLLEKNG
jgi:hypothetical protein